MSETAPHFQFEWPDFVHDEYVGGRKMIEKVLPPRHSVQVKDPAPDVRRGARAALSSQDALCTRGDIVQSNS